MNRKFFVLTVNGIAVAGAEDIETLQELGENMLIDVLSGKDKKADKPNRMTIAEGTIGLRFDKTVRFVVSMDADNTTIAHEFDIAGAEADYRARMSTVN